MTILLALIALWTALCMLPVTSGFTMSSLRGIFAPSYALIATCAALQPALANTRTVGSIETSGIVFKDKLTVHAIKDPKLEGITIYISDFDRPVTEKLGNIFDDPSSSSLTCVQTAPIDPSALGRISSDQGGEEVFKEDKNLFFKQIRIKRLYDKETNSVVYASFSTRLDKGDDSNKSRFKSSLCAVHIQ